MIWIDSTVLSTLISAEGQSNPKVTSFIASPEPTPRPIRPGYNTSREAKACAINPGLYRYTAAVTPVINFIFFVLSAMAEIQTHVKFPCPFVCDHGLKWSLVRVDSKPALSASFTKSINCCIEYCSCDAQYPISVIF